MVFGPRTVTPRAPLVRRPARAVAAALLGALVITAACGPAGSGGSGQPVPGAASPRATAPAAAGPAATPGQPTAGASATPRAAQTAQCGQVITADFTLANDLTCPRDALVAGADGITIDLGGKTLKGPGMGPQTWPAPQLDSVGVRVERRSGITVKNGSTSDFSTGVYFDFVKGSVIEGIRSERSRYGLYIHNSDGNAIRRNHVSANIYGLHLQRANDNVVQGNQLVRQTYNSPGGYGIYLFASERNRIVENDIENNVNWGIWFSEARGNVTFHNNVAGNRPQVSDNTEGNVWHDAATKRGNHWGDYRGADTNGDGIGDSGAYRILGPADVVDPYPFVERDGWKKTSRTIDTYAPPPPGPPKEVRLVAQLADGSVTVATPRSSSATPTAFRASTSIGLGTDGRTLYALDAQALAIVDLRAGTERARETVRVADGIVAANRDGESVIVIGRRGGEQLRPGEAARQLFDYVNEPTGVAPSYKHNQVFVGTPRGVDMIYLGPGTVNYGHPGRVAYTIPLAGPAGAMAMNGSGTRIYVAVRGLSEVAVVDTEQFAVVGRITVPGEVRAVAVALREDRLFVATERQLLAIDLGDTTRRVRATFLGTIVDLAVSPNGDEVYAALAGLDQALAVVDARTLASANIIPLDRAPTRLLAAAY